MADNYGDVIYLGERDCSMQRRNQKVLEEAPSPASFMNEELRAKMGKAAWVQPLRSAAIGMQALLSSLWIKTASSISWK